MKIRYKNQFDKQRRDIFKAIASAGISNGLLRASPLVAGMMAARVAEAAGTVNKSILTFVAGGALDNLWRPTSGLGLKSMSQEYEDVKNDVNFIVGASMVQGGHGIMFERFTARSFNEDSFDVNVGRILSQGLPVPYANLGVKSEATRLSRQGGTEIPTQDNPNSAFDAIFGAGSTGSSSGSTFDPKRLMVDAHLDAVKALQGKLGQHEKIKLDNHLTAIEELQAKLGSGSSSGGGSTPSCNASKPSPGGLDEFDQIANLQIEIAILALKCDLTRSVSISFGNDGHEFRIPVYDENMHTSHHCCPGTSRYETTARYMHGLNARLVRRVKQEGLLDSTIITQVSDMGDATAHTNVNVPLTISGGGSAVRRGVVNNQNGKTSKDMFQTVANILGVDADPISRKWSSSPMGGIAN